LECKWYLAFIRSKCEEGYIDYYGRFAHYEIRKLSNKWMGGEELKKASIYSQWEAPQWDVGKS